MTEIDKLIIILLVLLIFMDGWIMLAISDVEGGINQLIYRKLKETEKES